MNHLNLESINKYIIDLCEIEEKKEENTKRIAEINHPSKHKMIPIVKKSNTGEDNTNLVLQSSTNIEDLKSSILNEKEESDDDYDEDEDDEDEDENSGDDESDLDDDKDDRIDISQLKGPIRLPSYSKLSETTSPLISNAKVQKAASYSDLHQISQSTNRSYSKDSAKSTPLSNRNNSIYIVFGLSAILFLCYVNETALISSAPLIFQYILTTCEHINVIKIERMLDIFLFGVILVVIGVIVITSNLGLKVKQIEDSELDELDDKDEDDDHDEGGGDGKTATKEVSYLRYMSKIVVISSVVVTVLLASSSYPTPLPVLEDPLHEAYRIHDILQVNFAKVTTAGQHYMSQLDAMIHSFNSSNLVLDGKSIQKYYNVSNSIQNHYNVSNSSLAEIGSTGDVTLLSTNPFHVNINSQAGNSHHLLSINGLSLFNDSKSVLYLHAGESFSFYGDPKKIWYKRRNRWPTTSPNGTCMEILVTLNTHGLLTISKSPQRTVASDNTTCANGTSEINCTNSDVESNGDITTSVTISSKNIVRPKGLFGSIFKLFTKSNRLWSGNLYTLFERIFRRFLTLPPCILEYTVDLEIGVITLYRPVKKASGAIRKPWLSLSSVAKCA